MSNHYLNVYDAHNLIVDPSFTPEDLGAPWGAGKLWDPSKYTDSAPGTDPMLIGFHYGQLIKPSGSGANDGKVLTVVGIGDSGGTPSITVLETLTVDSDDYDFQLLGRSIGVQRFPVDPTGQTFFGAGDIAGIATVVGDAIVTVPTPNVWGLVTDYDMEWADTTYWLPAPLSGGKIIVTKVASFIGGEGLCLRIQNTGEGTYNYAYQVIAAGGAPDNIIYDIYCRSVDGVAYPRVYVEGWMINGTTSTSPQHYTSPGYPVWGGPPVDLRLYCQNTGVVEFDLVKVDT